MYSLWQSLTYWPALLLHINLVFVPNDLFFNSFSSFFMRFSLFSTNSQVDVICNRYTMPTRFLLSIKHELISVRPEGVARRSNKHYWACHWPYKLGRYGIICLCHATPHWHWRLESLTLNFNPLYWFASTCVLFLLLSSRQFYFTGKVLLTCKCSSFVLV